MGHGWLGIAVVTLFLFTACKTEVEMLMRNYENLLPELLGSSRSVAAWLTFILFFMMMMMIMMMKFDTKHLLTHTSAAFHTMA